MGTLFRDIGAIVPDEKGGFAFRRCDISVTGELITGVGRIPEGFEADRIIDGTGKLLIPGLINAHTHAYMTMFRNCADDLDFTDWLFGKIMPLEDKLNDRDCYWGTKLAYMEMLATGTTTSLDMYIFTHAAAEAQQETGIRAVMSRGLTGGPVSDPKGGQRRLSEARAEIEKWRGAKNLSFMLGPHAPYTCEPEYLKEVAALSAELKVGLNVHLAESWDEINTIKEKYGCTPVEYLDSAGILRDDTVCAHCVHLTDGDMALMAERGVSVASNPVSNLKLGNGIADIPGLMRAGVNVAIGTDGTASNNALNVFRDMGYMALLHKGISGKASTISAQQAFYMATAGGAKALGLAGITGEIREGLLADLVLLDVDKPWCKPDNNMIAALCYSMNGSEVEAVMVGGRMLYENGEYTTIDAERTAYEVEQTCERIGMRG